MDESLLKKAEHNISENLRGWVSREEFEKQLPEHLSVHHIQPIKEYINDRDKISIRSTQTQGTQSAYFISRKQENPYQEYKEKIPSNTHDIFNEWVGQGKAPRVIVALITYLTSEDKTVMTQIAEEHECCTASLTNNSEDMKKDLRDEGLKVYD